MAHKWQPIADLDESDINQPVHEELRHLAEIWREQQTGLDEKQLHIFNEKLKREWAIETGLIERAYHLDRGTTRLLIERGISERLIPRDNGQNPGIVAAMLRDHENVIDWLFDFIRIGRKLSVGYVKELHSAMMQNQKTAAGVDKFGNKMEIPLLRGQLKKLPNDPVTVAGETHEYCPPEQTASEMDRLIEMHLSHSARKIPPLAEAAWLHHRFVQVHPFQDGNGRVARCLASLIFIKEGWFPLVVRNELREKYLDSLEYADNGDLSPLINFFAGIQKRFFVDTLGIARAITHQDTADLSHSGRLFADAGSSHTPESSLVAAAMRKIKQRNQDLMRDYEEAKSIATSLHASACERLEGIKEQVVCAAENNEAEAWVSHAKNGESNDYFFGNQVVAAAKHLGYYANTSVYRAWIRLALKAEQRERAEILLFFHGVGPYYRGLIGCSACFILRERTDEGTQISEPKIISDEVFQINYKEPPEQVRKRFESWLDKVIPVGIYYWQETL